MLTKEKLTEYKSDYPVYHPTTVTDEYGHEHLSYPTTPTDTINVMWSPVTDEAAIAIYGEHVTSMKQCVLYDDTVEHFDRVEIGSDMYEVVSVMPYNTHLLVRVKKL